MVSCARMTAPCRASRRNAIAAGGTGSPPSDYGRVQAADQSHRTRDHPSPGRTKQAGEGTRSCRSRPGPQGREATRGLESRSEGRRTTQAGEGTRTLDIQLGKLTLYQLSYTRNGGECTGGEGQDAARNRTGGEWTRVSVVLPTARRSGPSGTVSRGDTGSRTSNGDTLGDRAGPPPRRSRRDR